MQKKFFYLLLVPLMLFPPSILLAQAYQHEVIYNHSEMAEYNGVGEGKGDLISYKYFLSEIESSNLPFREEEFGSRISSVGVSYGVQDIETIIRTFGGITQVSSGSQANATRVFGEYKHPVKAWFVGGHFSDGKTEGRRKVDNSSYSVRFGKYLAAYSTVSLAYSEWEDDVEPYNITTCSGAFGGGACVPPLNTAVVNSSTEIQSYSISGRHLQEIADKHFAFGLHYEDSDTTSETAISGGLGGVPFLPGKMVVESKSYSVDITAYWRKGLATGISYSKIDSDSLVSEAKQFGLSLEYYLNSQLAIRFDYVKNKLDNFGVSAFPTLLTSVSNEQEIFSLSLRGRF